MTMRSRRAPLAAAAAAALFFSSIDSAPVAAQENAVKAEPVYSGFHQPVFVTHDNSSQLLYVVEQEGRIRVIDNGVTRPEPFLDIVDRVSDGGECGLLGLAFHPKFWENGRFFVNYTTERNPGKKGGEADTIVAEYKLQRGAKTVDPATEKIVLRFPQPWRNHNGGCILFGPDKKLYIGNGDGGAGGDPRNFAQTMDSLLGKMLRIDVDAKSPYGIPWDNPFVGNSKYLPEIWATGLRNPWRFSFDRETGVCYAGDVGQNKFEEIDIIEKGKNYGWSASEGFQAFKPERGLEKLTDPIKAYPREQGVSVTGGYVYRGKAIPDLNGVYLYADYASGRVWGLRYEKGKLTYDRELFKLPIQISSFGEDSAGEVYICSHGNGEIWKIAPK